MIVGLVVMAIVGFAVYARVGSKRGSSAAHTAGTGSPRYPVAYAATTCPADDASRVAGLVCGTLTVPEDRSKPHGRVVKLDVYRAPARGVASGDPVLDFGADNLATSPARDHSEEIQLATRGASGAPGSNPVLTCPEYAKIAADALVKPSGDATERRRDAAAIRACHDGWTRAGVDLDQYNYLAAGDDMADLIRALHFSHVNLVSGYVASISALEVVRQLPNVVRTLTLQEPVAPGQSAFTDPTKYLSDAFNNYVALCRADAACEATFPDLPDQLRHDYDIYRTAPRMVQGDDGNGHKHAVWLDGSRAAMALSAALSHSEAYPVIAAVIAATHRSGAIDTATAGEVIADNPNLLEPQSSWGATLSEWCSYDVHTIDIAGSAISRQTLPQLSGVDNGFLQWACNAWPVHEIGQMAYADPSTTVPTLIVTPTLLPAAEPQWAEVFQRGLPNATVLTFPTLDGAVLDKSDPPCLAALRRAFLADPPQPLDAATCERQSPPIHFLASLGG